MGTIVQTHRLSNMKLLVLSCAVLYLSVFSSHVRAFDSPTDFLTDDQPKKPETVRTYVAANWTTISVQANSPEAASSIGFMPLFQYISGNNAEKAKVAMTAPVATFKHPLENWYTVAFYVPEKYQS